ncbi:MAG: hypothetical protein ACE5JB_15970 [bacterium]
MKKIILFVILTIILSSTAAFAQQEKGDTEIQIAGTYFTTVGSEFTFSSGFIQAKLGKYITDNLELGIAPNISITTVDLGFGESDTNVTFGGGAFFVYSFLAGDAKTVPYFGGQYYKSDFSNEDDNGSVGVTGGAKFFVTEKAAFDFSGNYLFDLNEDTEGGLLLFAAGISFLF